MKKLGLSHRPTFRQNYLQPVVDAGVVERTLPDKPTKSAAEVPAHWDLMAESESSRRHTENIGDKRALTSVLGR